MIFFHSRTMIPERIVAQYTQYCKEVSFAPFSRSTMLRILSSCAATVRKSLQGLDYFAADGGKAFDELIGMIPKLRSDDRSWVSRLQKELKESKQYIKADYKVCARMKLTECVTTRLIKFGFTFYCWNNLRETLRRLIPKF